MELPNIAFKGNIPKDVQAANDAYTQISYFKSLEDFYDEGSYSKYIKSVENLVRTSNDYKAFLAYIKNTLGINFCQVMDQIYDEIDATIEFHHGPLFTLYDICETELSKYIQTGVKINTFRLANSVIDLHFQMKVNGVMLSKTAHEMGHNGDLFLNLNQSVGDINAYIVEYGRYFTPEVKYKVWNYVDMCKNNPSFDTGALDMEVVQNYVKPVVA